LNNRLWQGDGDFLGIRLIFDVGTPPNDFGTADASNVVAPVAGAPAEPTNVGVNG